MRTATSASVVAITVALRECRFMTPALAEASPGPRVKFITPVGAAAGKKFDQFTAIDDCTRIRVLKADPRCNQKTATSSSTAS